MLPQVNKNEKYFNRSSITVNYFKTSIYENMRYVLKK